MEEQQNYYKEHRLSQKGKHIESPEVALFYLPMLVTMCFFDLFSYKVHMHRKWVRLKYVSYLLLDALFCFNSYFLCEHLLKFLRLAQRR
jgi:hypothetical protein